MGMSLDYSHPGEVHISMIRYVKDLYDMFKQAQLKVDDGFIEVKKKEQKFDSANGCPQESLCCERGVRTAKRRGSRGVSYNSGEGSVFCQACDARHYDRNVFSYKASKET